MKSISDIFAVNPEFFFWLLSTRFKRVDRAFTHRTQIIRSGQSSFAISLGIVPYVRAIISIRCT